MPSNPPIPPVGDPDPVNISRTTTLPVFFLHSSNSEPSWPRPSAGPSSASPYHVQLFMCVLQGHLRGLLQLLAHDLEEVQCCHLNGAKQEGLLGRCVLDVCPARFLGREVAACKYSTVERDSSARACVCARMCICVCGSVCMCAHIQTSRTQSQDFLPLPYTGPAAYPEDDITAGPVEAHLQSCQLIVVLEDLIVLLLHVAGQPCLGAFNLLLAFLGRLHEVMMHAHQRLVTGNHLVDLLKLRGQWPWVTE